LQFVCLQNNSALIQLTTGSGKSEIIADPNVIYSVPDTVEAKAFDEIKNTLSSEDHRNALKTAGLMRNLDKTIKKTYIWTI
jgi:hypothetical protein